MGPPLGTPGATAAATVHVKRHRGPNKGQRGGHSSSSSSSSHFESGLTPDFNNLLMFSPSLFSPNGQIIDPMLSTFGTGGRTPFGSRTPGCAMLPVGFTPAGFDRQGRISTPMSDISIASNLSPSVFASPSTMAALIRSTRRKKNRSNSVVGGGTGGNGGNNGGVMDALSVLAEASAKKMPRESVDAAALDDFELSPSFGAHNFLDADISTDNPLSMSVLRCDGSGSAGGCGTTSRNQVATV